MTEYVSDCLGQVVSVRPVMLSVHQTQGLCTRAYYNHKQGCPNYNHKKGCPPNVKMFNEVYDLSKHVYAIYNIFDFWSHVQRMKKKHPEWSKRQLECCLYWQGKARKELRERIIEFKKIPKFKEYTVTECPEAMGINVTRTMLNKGIKLEWPPRYVTFQIVMAGILNPYQPTAAKKEKEDE